MNNIPGIEEVNIFKDDSVIHFVNPKVQASIQANTYVVSGSPVVKGLHELLPGILSQLGPDSLPYMQKFGQQAQTMAAQAAAMGGMGAAAGAAVEAKDDGDDDGTCFLFFFSILNTIAPPAPRFVPAANDGFLTCSPRATHARKTRTHARTPQMCRISLTRISRTCRSNRR